MASVYQKRGVWYLRVKSATGKWLCIRSGASTKTEAKRLAAERQREEDALRRQRVTAPNLDPSMQFGALLDFWWDEYGSKLRSAHIKSSVDTHLRPALGNLTLLQVTGAQVEAVLNAKVGTLAPDTLNRLRSVVHRVFEVAIRRGLWVGGNPAKQVPRFKVPRRLPEYLRAHEVPALLDVLGLEFRPMFATAIFTGVRKGELLGLRKADVDLTGGTIAVARSYDADTTKGARAALIPIAQELRPFIERAMAASNSDLLFPAPDGTTHRRDYPLGNMLRRALGRAGIVRHFEHRCRKQGCGFKVIASDPVLRFCPKCATPKKSRKLWPVAVPRHVRWHDLRHTTATLLLKASVPLATVQRILRHSNPRITSEIYGHLDVEDMRAGLDRLPFKLNAGTPPAKDTTPANAMGSEAVCYPLATGEPSEGVGEKDEPPETSTISGGYDGRPDGFRTCDLFRVKASGNRPAVIGDSHRASDFSGSRREGRPAVTAVRRQPHPFCYNGCYKPRRKSPERHRGA